MAVASLVIITLVKAVRAGREHLLAGETRPCAAVGAGGEPAFFLEGCVIVFAQRTCSRAHLTFKSGLEAEG